jgi:hypothetical protein
MSSSSSISSSPPVTLICSVCGEKSSLRCSNCLGAFYCSIPCQKKDWKTHKVICKQAQEVKKSYEALGCHTVEEIDAKLEEDTESWQSWVMQKLNIIWVFHISVAWVWVLIKLNR